jgi:pilus assembly protein Flp/PilA
MSALTAGWNAQGSAVSRSTSRRELTVSNFLTKFHARAAERGATAVEYGLMVALIAIVIIVAVALLGGNLSGIFNKVAGSV